MRQIVRVERGDTALMDGLNQLMQGTFGFSFRKWHEAGFWDEHYRPFALVGDGQVLANVSVSEMELLQNGQRLPAIQIGAVATWPKFRGQGLARRLMEFVLNQYVDRPAFLFAHAAVTDFYPHFGFRPLREVQPYVELDQPVAGFPPIRLNANAPKVIELVRTRKQRSAIIDVQSALSINMFHLLMGLGKNIYYLEEQDCILVAKQEQNAAIIYDIISAHDVDWGELATRLPFPGIRTVEFAFTPDWLGIDYQEKPLERYDDFGYLFGLNIDFGNHAKFPYLSMT